MILLLCGVQTCGMDMMVRDIQYVPNSDNNKVTMIYHLGCENMHKSEIKGEQHEINEQSAERRVINFLIQQSESKYGKVISN